MSNKGFKLDIDRAKSFSDDAAQIGTAVESLLKHSGWQVFLALFENKKREILKKEDYVSLEDFRADRSALKIVQGIFDLMPTYIEDATEAQLLLKKLTEAENQTPISLMLGDEDDDAREG